MLRRKYYDRLWIQPASGDAGGALGAAMVGPYGVWSAGFGRAVDSRRRPFSPGAECACRHQPALSRVDYIL
ncbi:MAG: hypothetical protein WBD13_12130 [Burkholderiaceae bacterium]